MREKETFFENWIAHVEQRKTSSCRFNRFVVSKNWNIFNCLVHSNSNTETQNWTTLYSLIAFKSWGEKHELHSIFQCENTLNDPVEASFHLREASQYIIENDDIWILKHTKGNRIPLDDFNKFPNQKSCYPKQYIRR